MRAARAENGKAGTGGTSGTGETSGIGETSGTGEIGGTSRCLYFGNGSLIVRLLFALPVSFLYRLYRVSGKRKKNLLISKFAN